MNESSKITSEHLCRCALVYVRQSSAAQVEHNRESTERQYRLGERAISLGWKRETVEVIDEDLGISASGVAERSGFARMTARVALGQIGIVLGLEVSRLARNNADWYRLLDLCGVTNTLIADADGIYHPGLLNDRLILGLKGTMSEVELHILRARLVGGIRNKAARGELRLALPVGLIWGDVDGEIRFHPDEAVTETIRTVFKRFAELGSARQVWLWFRSEKVRFPFPSKMPDQFRWEVPTYTKIYDVLTSPVYAGAYAYGQTRYERYVDETGRLRERSRRLPRSEWTVLIQNHHEGFIDWDTFEANRRCIAANAQARADKRGGAVREGPALLQGIASCGRCGRKLRVVYTGRNSTPRYYCTGDSYVNANGDHCLHVRGCQIDAAVADAFLAAVAPAGIEASLRAAEEIECGRDAALSQRRQDVERARYEAQRAERRYRAVDPENRLVARSLEAEWEESLKAVAAAEAELAHRERQQPRALTMRERQTILSLGSDLKRVWSAVTTTDRDRKQLLRTLLEEVIIAVQRDEQQHQANLTLRWRGGLLSELKVSLHPSGPAPRLRTDEETVALVRRLAVHYPDSKIAGILNQQGRRTATGMRFTTARVGGLRAYWGIPCFERPSEPPEGELVSIERAAEILDVATTTVRRWLNDGFIAGDQITPGAPWRIRITDELRSRIVEVAPPGFVLMLEATHILGVSRQTVMHRVKRGELEAVHVNRGRRKGLRIKVPLARPSLFDAQHRDGG